MSDSEKYFTKMVDGQLSVATVAQSGEIIPEEDRPGDKYTTALVQTDDGPQLCVKTYDLNGGGGGGGGGVLVVTDTNDTLDKTWQEIHDAFIAGSVRIQQGTNILNVKTVGYSSREGTYGLACDVYGSYKSYTTDSASGYPTLGV